MKNILFIVFSVIFTMTLKAQASQFGFFLETQKNFITLKDSKTPLSFGGGISVNSFLSDKFDFIGEIGYLYNKLESPDIYNKKAKLHTIHTNLLVNYYLITPNLNKLFISIQAGLGSNFMTQFEFNKGGNDYEVYDTSDHFKPYALVGISGGTESIRLSLRYKPYFEGFVDNSFKMNSISLNLTYYLTNFLN